jgi:hypothetical protein
VLAARAGVSLADELAKFAPAGLTTDQKSAFVKEAMASLRDTQQEEAEFYVQLGHQ